MKKANNLEMRKCFARVLACMMLICVLTGCKKVSAPEQEEFQISGVAAESSQYAVEETEAPIKEMSVTDTLKDDLETALEAVKDNSLDIARSKTEGLAGKTETIRSSVSVTLNNLGDSTPSIQKELRNVQKLLDLTDQLAEKILMPTIEMLEEYSSEQMREEGSVNTKLVCDYLDFAESLMPEIEALVNAAAEVDLSLVDSDGDAEEYLKVVEELVAEYRENPAAMSAIKAIFGDGEDRVYLIAVQNTAEIRASGGFPGAMGVARIQNGDLMMQDFKKVYDVLADYTPQEAKITQKESLLFHYGLQVPRDADFCPDYERVAYVWSLGYRSRQMEEVDGVISMTPIFAQRLLKAMGEEIKLFDGTVVNGDNAERVLQHDIYYKYYGTEYVAARDVVTDQLFADAAKKILQKFTENLEIKNLMDYLSVAKDSVADRTLMLWMADEEEQEIIRQLGWHGGLNSDPQKPQAGVYVNNKVAGKMGMFLGMETVMGDRTKNEDGSYTYPVTVTLTNNITDEEVRNAQWQITGGDGGVMNFSAYFFAPAGGTIREFSTSNNVPVIMEEYKDLQLGFWRDFNIYPGKPLTVTYNVTTAPGVETPLEFSKTPTIENMQ